MARLPAALALCLAAATTARAGDVAALDILGFSADGGVFAFEEYGVQDGSGFPYANRYYIDTRSDSFLAGTPVRVRIDADGASVATARAEAKAKGEAFVPAAELAANRGHTAALNPLTELNADPFRIVASPRPIVPSPDAPLELRLAEVPVPPVAECFDLGTAVGFRLARIDAGAGGVTQILHEDRSVPKSRGCATGYRLGGVQVHAADGLPSVFAVMIAVEKVGFEGPDHRWIAVTGRF